MTVIKQRHVADPHLMWVRQEVIEGGSKPVLAVVSQDMDNGCKTYSDKLKKDAQDLGVKVREIPAGADVYSTIKDINADNSIHGVLVLYGVGQTLEEETAIMRSIALEKDVEGLHPSHKGDLVDYRVFFDYEEKVKCIVPATPKAVMKILDYISSNVRPLDFKGAPVTIINNSMRIGKPLHLMLTNWKATVTNCDEYTPKKDLEDHIKRASLLVSGVPNPNFKIDPHLVRQDAVVIDVSNSGNTKGLEKRVEVYVPRTGAVTRAMTWVNLMYCISLQSYLRSK